MNNVKVNTDLLIIQKKLKSTQNTNQFIHSAKNNFYVVLQIELVNSKLLIIKVYYNITNFGGIYVTK